MRADTDECHKRISLWFGSFLLSVTLFSLFFGHIGGAVFVFRTTMRFALPVAFLYLPLVVAFKNAEEQRSKLLLVVGILIGPVSMALWGFILQLRDGAAHRIWNPEAPSLGVLPCMFFALIVGSLTTACYVAALKVLSRRSPNQPPG